MQLRTRNIRICPITRHFINESNPDFMKAFYYAVEHGEPTVETLKNYGFDRESARIFVNVVETSIQDDYPDIYTQVSIKDVYYINYCKAVLYGMPESVIALHHVGKPLKSLIEADFVKEEWKIWAQDLNPERTRLSLGLRLAMSETFPQKY